MHPPFPMGTYYLKTHVSQSVTSFDTVDMRTHSITHGLSTCFFFFITELGRCTRRPQTRDGGSGTRRDSGEVEGCGGSACLAAEQRWRFPVCIGIEIAAAGVQGTD